MSIFSKLFSPPDIEKMKSERDIDNLNKALRHNDLNVRKTAAQALGELANFLGFPKFNWETEPYTWIQEPLLHPYRFWQEAAKNWLQDGEEVLGLTTTYLPIKEVQRNRVDSGHVSITYEADGGSRAQDLVTSIIGQYGKLPSNINYLLYVTNHRILVKNAGATQFWETPIQAVQGVKVKEGGRISFDTAYSIILDFGDNDPLALGNGIYNQLFKLHLLKWADECNRFLEAIHRQDVLFIDSYVKYMRAMNRDGNKVVNSLKSALEKEKNELVKNEMIKALTAIRGEKPE